MRKMVAAMVLALTILPGCGMIFQDGDRAIPNRNHRNCGIDGEVVFGDFMFLFLGGVPGVIAYGVDIINGSLWYSDDECAARYGTAR